MMRHKTNDNVAAANLEYAPAYIASYPTNHAAIRQIHTPSGMEGPFSEFLQSSGAKL